MRYPAVLIATLALVACAHAQASPVAQEPRSAAPPPVAAVRLPEAPRAFQAVRKAAPVVAAVATEALDSAPAVAVAAATGGPLAGVWTFVTNNPTLVGLGLGLVVLLVVHVLRMRGVLTPERAAAITAVTLPVAQSPEVRSFVANSPTKLDDLGLNVLEKLNAELQKIGATKPAEVAFAKSLVVKAAQTAA